MIYRKIENFLEPLMDDKTFPIVVGAIVYVILAPVWFPFWLVSRFWNTPSK